MAGHSDRRMGIEGMPERDEYQMRKGDARWKGDVFPFFLLPSSFPHLFPSFSIPLAQVQSTPPSLSFLSPPSFFLPFFFFPPSGLGGGELMLLGRGGGKSGQKAAFDSK